MSHHIRATVRPLPGHGDGRQRAESAEAPGSCDQDEPDGPGHDGGVAQRVADGHVAVVCHDSQDGAAGNG